MTIDERKQVERAWTAVIEALFEVDKERRNKAIRMIQQYAEDLPDMMFELEGDDSE